MTSCLGEYETPFDWTDLADTLDNLFPMATLNQIKELLLTGKQIANVPIPQFHGKKGEVPEDHLYKVNNYFTNYKIETEGDMLKRFKDTLCGKAKTRTHCV